MLQINNHKLVNVPFNTLPHSNSSLTPTYITAHYTAGTSVSGSISHLISVGLSYHVIIDRDGTLTQCAPFNKRAGHAGVSNWKGLNDLNNFSIGICFANRGYVTRFDNGSYGMVNAHNDPIGGFLTESEVFQGEHFNGSVTELYWEKYTDAQLTVFRELCQVLIQRYPTIKDIHGHDEIALGRKQDPGPAFQISDFFNLVPNRTSDVGQVATVQSPDGMLNVRRGPSGNFKLLQQLQNGQRVVVRSEGYKFIGTTPLKSGWASIGIFPSTDHIGFVNKSFLI